jgi:hypothetical protein
VPEQRQGLGQGLAGTAVFALQQALVAIGAMQAEPDGDFGPLTQRGVQVFRWYRTHMACRLARGGQIEECVCTSDRPPGAAGTSARADEALLDEARAWQHAGATLTGPLVRLPLSQTASMRLAAGFSVLDNPSLRPGELLVNERFVPAFVALDRAASALGVVLHVNQAFRLEGRVVSGAVVMPADNSQHLVGHALDLNIVDRGVVNTSVMFRRGRATGGAIGLVEAARRAGLRWGGDFVPQDPPHFDLPVPPTSDDYRFGRLLAQRSIAHRHPLRLASGVDAGQRTAVTF